MRLLLALAAAAVGGCSLAETCGPFGEPRVFSGVTAEAAGVPASDTLTVLFVADGMGEFGSYDAVPDRAEGTTLRLTVDGQTDESREPPRFETAVRGDTVWVRAVRPLVREACSPAQGDAYDVVRIDAPGGVRVVRFRTVWHAEAPFPVAAPAARAPLFRTV